MKRIIRLTESDLTRIVRRVINESSRQYLMEANEYDGAVQNLLTQIANVMNKYITSAKSRGVKVSSTVSVVQEGEYNKHDAYVLKYGDYPFFTKGKSYPLSDGVLVEWERDTTGKYARALDDIKQGITDVFPKKLPKELQQLPDFSENILKIFNTWVAKFKPQTPQKPGVK